MYASGSATPPDLHYPDEGQIFVCEQSSCDWFQPPRGAAGGIFPQDGFQWHSRSVCKIAYEGQVSADSTFATGVVPIRTSFPTDSFGGWVEDLVEGCHTYYWRVREVIADTQGPWSAAGSFRIVPPGGESECGILQASIEAVATQNATCRLGPGTAYGISSYVPAGESHPVEGRNADGTWLKLQDLGCYIYRGLLALEVGGTPFPGGADVSDLMSVLPDPPLPTETPAEGSHVPACSSTLSQAECGPAGGTWVVGAVPYCKCP